MASKGTWRLSSHKDPRWNASGGAVAPPAALSALAPQAIGAMQTSLGQSPPDDLTTEGKVASAAAPGVTDRPTPAPSCGFAQPAPPPRPAPVRVVGPPRCPSCGER